LSYAASRVVAQTTLRLKVLAEPDPSALVQVLHALQARNLTPQRVHAERIKICKSSDEMLDINIELDATHIDHQTLQTIASKIDQFPSIVIAVVG
jgi:hypothetical protein